MVASHDCGRNGSDNRTLKAGACCAVSALALVLALFLPGLGAAQAVPGTDPPGRACPDTNLTVFAVDPDLGARVCAIVQAADPLLSACGLPGFDPLRLYITRRIEGTSRHCLGVYVSDTNEIAVVDPAVLAEDRGAGSMFDGLEPDALFASLVIHEITHARLANLANGKSCSLADHEYIAYAMQLAALPDDQRDIILEDVPKDHVGTALLNDVILTMSPRVFAGLAWRHFARPENGCRYVRSLLDGAVTLEMSNP